MQISVRMGIGLGFRAPSDLITDLCWTRMGLHQSALRCDCLPTSLIQRRRVVTRFNEFYCLKLPIFSSSASNSLLLLPLPFFSMPMLCLECLDKEMLLLILRLLVISQIVCPRYGSNFCLPVEHASLRLSPTAQCNLGQLAPPFLRY